LIGLSSDERKASVKKIKITIESFVNNYEICKSQVSHKIFIFFLVNFIPNEIENQSTIFVTNEI